MTPGLLLLFSTMQIQPLEKHQQGFAERDVEILQMYHGLPGEQLGGTVRILGDLDGDGLDEWAINGPFHNPGNRRKAGRVVVISGATGKIVRQHVGPTRRTELTGPWVGPDLDDDGIPEYGVSAGTASTAGEAWIYSGDLSLEGEDALLHYAEESSWMDLWALGENAGDINGDGVEDFFWQAEFAETSRGTTGFLEIISGADRETVLRRHEGGRPGDRIGNAAGTLGDIDNDGMADYWIGVPQSNPPQTRGFVQIYSGGRGIPLAKLQPNQSWGAVFSLFYAYTMGDITGDRIPELYVADTGDYRYGLDTGRIYVFDPVTGSQVWRRLGPGGHEGFGIGHPFGFDVTGDDRDELIVGSYLHSSQAADAGRVQLLDGATGRILRTITSTTAGETFGSDCVGIPDRNGDGIPELAVSAWLSNRNGAKSGTVYVIAGRDHRGS